MMLLLLMLLFIKENGLKKLSKSKFNLKNLKKIKVEDIS